MRIEAHEEFVQHIENGSSKIRALSLMTIAVAALLAVSYVYQLALPLITGTMIVQINLADPSLMATEIVLVVLALAWLYVGLRDYLFTQRLTKQIKEARRLEGEIMKKYGLNEESN